jgi:oxygen-independent coproporphyrinogen-3 oxidase
MPDTDRSADMQLACQERLAEARYLQYEVSAYARPGARCRHNLNYWQFGDYLGVGAGAHGKRSRFEQGRLLVERSVQPREPRRYLASLAAARAQGQTHAVPTHEVPPAELPFEYLLNALRLNQGFQQGEFELRTGLSFALVADRLAAAQRRGLIQCSATRWRASAQGFNFLNDLLADFLPPRGPLYAQRREAAHSN